MSASVRAFRALTASPADGAATRARVLARAGRTRGRRASWRRIATAAFATMAISISASAAWRTFSPAWRAAAPIVVENEEAPSLAPPEPAGPRAIRSIPVEHPEAAPPADQDSEAQLYARAHRAHFVDQSPARAVAAWSEYLRRFPRGALAPEAAFNRALCLIHLGRLDEATRALRTFAAHRPDGYRQADVERLLDWLRAQQAPATPDL